MAIASVVGFVNLGSNLPIIMLRFKAGSSSNTSLLSHQTPHTQINVLIDGTEGLYFLMKETFKYIY